MKILWVKSDFLHPTTRGGQIRTLETVRRLHQKHEVHYVAYENPAQPEGVARSTEYCTRSYPVQHSIPSRGSAAFAVQLLQGLASPLPLAVSRYKSPAMRKTIDGLLQQHRFDSVVCDFLFPAPNIDFIDRCVLFQHNVETMIWRRHAETATDPLRKLYFGMQADRMFRYEEKICKTAGHIIAVSPQDADLMRNLFGVEKITSVPTGVDVESFSPPPSSPQIADLVFVGSMDWMPNIDGIEYFVKEVLPLIRKQKPDCSLAIVGRTPPRSIVSLAENDPGITVTGTVPDVKPYLWGSSVSIVPLRIGGGTRLKIYEAMAARVPVVSTTIGAEGLCAEHPRTIRLADTTETFAQNCLGLLNEPEERHRMASEAWGMVSSRFSWDQVTRSFEQILEKAPLR